MHGGWLIPPSQNIGAPPYARGGHAGRHHTTLVRGVSNISGKIAVRVIISNSVGGSRENLLMRINHMTVEIGLSADTVVTYVHMVVMVTQKRITARNRGGWNRDWILGMVCVQEHGFVYVIRVFRS